MNEHFAWKVAHVDYRSVTPTANVCGPSRECMLIRAIRWEYTLSRVPNQECTLLERSVRGWSSGCLRDVAGKVFCLPLSYFGTPRLGHVVSRCATRAGLPRSSAVERRSSTL
ncbi:hypothetical protein ACFXTI_041260 [Malus domestica]